MSRPIRAGRPNPQENPEGAPAIFELLEQRMLLSTVVTSGLLVIEGSGGDDVISVSPGPNRGEVIVSGDPYSPDPVIQSGVTAIEVHGGDGNDRIEVAGGIRTAAGKKVPALLDGGAGDDVLRGGDGDDTLLGGAGDDTPAGGGGNDLIDGGDGNDTVDYSQAAAGVVVRLKAHRARRDGDHGRDKLLGVENVVGSAYRDNIAGDDGANSIYGGGGDDTISGGKGDDKLDGGDGNDKLDGGDGNNEIDGGDGDDQLTGNNGDNTVADVENLAVGKRLSHSAVTIVGQAAPLSGLPHDVRVHLQTGRANGHVVTTIDEVQLEVDGNVLAIDTTNSTITLAGEDGPGPTTYTIGADVPITIDGVAGTLADIAVGSEAEVELSALDGTTVIAVKVETGGDQENGDNDGENGDQEGDDNDEHHGLFGSVVSVDTAAGMITVSSLSQDGPPVETTYTVAPTATITVDGKAATLDQLVSGVVVCLKTDPADPATVTSITAVGKEADGIVTVVDTVNNTLTLTGEHGAGPTTYTIGADVPITIDGAAVTLADIAIGSEAEVRFSALDGTTVIAVKVETGGDQDDGDQDDGDQDDGDQGDGDHGDRD